ncbi:lipoprotein insertase outer membrane protein LolB [Leucothrix mucor]|uniref:lipoprotein insertase outer membrane protein LolB n=1 Tax=Leucothrix mucor TaxID=45248 RepID=UPI0003B729C0|nr:lipoprotein insertase outer membrane protein LolB [Leucothrix mucor]
MNQFNKLVLAVLVGTVLAGCSTQRANQAPSSVISKPTPTKPVANPWERRQQTMNAMQSWDMSGRAALRFKGDGWTFGLNWQQKNKQQYVLQIQNPITGTLVAVLEQSPGKAVLKSQGKVHDGTDAERLLEQQLRVKMPVNGMPYWIRGVMAPQYPVGQVKLDAQGRPTQITQAGWVIDYDNYDGNDFAALPGKVNIARTQDQVNVRVLPRNWKIR